MIIVHNNEQMPNYRHSVVSVGNFDGIHRGHRALISALATRARENNATSIVLTFEPHTKTVLNPGAQHHLLATCHEKEILLRDLGVDIMACLRFNSHLAAMTPADFVDNVLVGRFKAIEWVMGDNHAFGYKREGSKDFLRKDTGRKHISIFAVALNSQQAAVISSTRIRSRIIEGRMREAVDMLGHPYLVEVERIRGKQTGTKLGFPTLNFKLPPSRKVIPPPGVYVAELESDSEKWTGALYIGNCPTFSDRDYHLEFHALSGNASYPEEGKFAFLWIHSFVRKDEIFNSPDELTTKIRQDILQIQEFFNKE
jgi:riboflavin kinase/FMN adenylyltransferase